MSLPRPSLLRPPTPPAPALPGLLVLLAACGPEPTPAPPVARVDSAGIEIVTSADSAWRGDDRWTVSNEPILEIGADPDAPDPYQLFQVTDAMRLADGRLVVANGGTREVRLFGPDGVWIRSLGGPGQGPEEYGYPGGLRTGPGNGFTVLDRVRYDRTGEFLARETFDRAAWQQTMRPLGRGEGATPLPDGHMIAPVYGEGSFYEETPRPGPLYRPEVTLLRVDPGTGAADTIARIGGILQQFVDVGAERASATVPPFAPSGRFFVGRDGGVVIYDGAVAEVHRLQPDGTHRVLRWNQEPEGITAAEVEAWKDEQRNASWVQGQLPRLERAWAAMDLPETKPMVTLAHPALDGSTWVRTGSYGPGPREWRVFAPDGRWLGTVPLSGTFTPMEIGDGYLLGIDRDPATETEALRLHSLAKPPGA